jgi:hypothetical protein
MPLTVQDRQISCDHPPQEQSPRTLAIFRSTPIFDLVSLIAVSSLRSFGSHPSISSPHPRADTAGACASTPPTPMFPMATQKRSCDQHSHSPRMRRILRYWKIVISPSVRYMEPTLRHRTLKTICSPKSTYAVSSTTGSRDFACYPNRNFDLISDCLVDRRGRKGACERRRERKLSGSVESIMDVVVECCRRRPSALRRDSSQSYSRC